LTTKSEESPYSESRSASSSPIKVSAFAEAKTDGGNGDTSSHAEPIDARKRS
jgi:hypothetical protein